MQFNIRKREPLPPGTWEKRFAWWPVRINNYVVIWLEGFERRYVVVDEGTWAGGYQYRYDYRTAWGEWQGPVICS